MATSIRFPLFCPHGGPGAWELVAHATYVDLDDKAITGGKFWRLTPMLNWYLSDHVRLEAAYGYGSLNRFGTVGKTHFFQSRIQLQLRTTTSKRTVPGVFDDDANVLRLGLERGLRGVAGAVGKRAEATSSVKISSGFSR